MKIKRTTRTTDITIERDELYVITKIERKVFWCAECGRETQTMTIEQVMTLARMKRGTSSIWGTTANIHLIETAAGRPLVCVNSLGP